MQKISFDFDSTLSRKVVQDFAIKLIGLGCEVWIVTSRFDDAPENITEEHPSWMKAFKVAGINNDVREVADSLNIPRERIVYTNMDLKAEYFKGKDFVMHLDDDWVELNHINMHTETIGISVFANNNWAKKAMKVLNQQ